MGQSPPEGLKAMSSEPSSIVQAAYHREELLSGLRSHTFASGRDNVGFGRLSLQVGLED